MAIMDLMLGGTGTGFDIRRSKEGAHARTEAPGYQIVLLGRSFAEARDEALGMLQGSVKPVLVRLTSQPFPNLDELNELHASGVPFVSIPDRLVHMEGPEAEARLLAEMRRALSAYLAANRRWEEQLRKGSSVPQAVEEPEGGELSDEGRQAFLRTMSGQGPYDDGIR